MSVLARVILISLLTATPLGAQGTQADYHRAAALRETVAKSVFGDKVEPQWSPDGTAFWYRNERPGGGHEHVVVNAVKATREVVPKDPLPKGWGQPGVPAKPSPRGDRATSPDGQWVALSKGHNIWLKDKKTGKERQLSTDGSATDEYRGEVYWSPDSLRFVAIRTKVGGDRRVTLVESAPPDRVQPKTHTHFYLKPGDDIPQPKPHLFDAATGKELPISDALFANPWDCSYYHWAADSKRFYFVYNQRGHQVVRLVSVDANTGEAKAVVNEECQTFFDYSNKLFVRHLESTNEVLWTSERGGWNHLYRVDRQTGKTCQITHGEWLIRGIDLVDEKTGEIGFRACGQIPGQDPYHIHYARVNLDGTGFTRLTDGDGTHTVTFSPDRRFYLDTYSRVDLPPVTELRRSSDGTKILDLETADATTLTKIVPLPERFVTKGRYGKTDIWGLIIRPSNFDPKKSYRVIEHIYAGPHSHHVAKRFFPLHYEQRLAELGFVVVKIDGMGTNWRSKAFHDVCWKNLGDAGFPDRITWIRAVAAKYSNLDITKGVGIFGGSAGGQNALRGMTEYPDFYTVGVADCGCHDNRMDKIWWNEAWMGHPIGSHYAEQSNVTNAHKLRGKLLLIVGELDRNVDPASTMQVANALIRADHDFDLLVIPGAGHGAAETPYGSRRRADFLVRHLLGVEPRVK